MRRFFDSAFGFAQNDSCLFAAPTKVREGRSSGRSNFGKPKCALPYGDVARAYAELLRLHLRFRSE